MCSGFVPLLGGSLHETQVLLYILVPDEVITAQMRVDSHQDHEEDQDHRGDMRRRRRTIEERDYEKEEADDDQEEHNNDGPIFTCDS